MDAQHFLGALLGQQLVEDVAEECNATEYQTPEWREAYARLSHASLDRDEAIWGRGTEAEQDNIAETVKRWWR